MLPLPVTLMVPLLPGKKTRVLVVPLMVATPPATGALTHILFIMPVTVSFMAPLIVTFQSASFPVWLIVVPDEKFVFAVETGMSTSSTGVAVGVTAGVTAATGVAAGTLVDAGVGDVDAAVAAAGVSEPPPPQAASRLVTVSRK